ncbi:MAG: UDP-N-acetylglucosamine 2-epimerase (non-hydrolyzing), partial [Candidatus Eremiobacteraeota bacterium]|nr:UDP-N-acetylglucosamine 2-epimerase (non-hydrolyzing) [Candidatus Eremiobacteraeota bacterium]
RPEIVKFSPLLPLFDEAFRHMLVHTGQHYDENMDRVFFKELQLKAPQHFLNIGEAGATPATQMARMLERLEPILAETRPDWVAVLGDTNSTLAGALAAAKQNLAVLHVEAGCRSFNREMPEEHNRVLVDHLSELLFAPDAEAVSHLKREGLTRGVYQVGNTGLDATRRTMQLADAARLAAFGVAPEAYAVATLHRMENTNDLARLEQLIEGINGVAKRTKVLFPVHPRTSAVLRKEKIALSNDVVTLPPLGNLDFIALLSNSLFVMSDSGGIQEEAAVVNVPCLILREETEWTRLVDAGKNFLVGTSAKGIVRTADRLASSTALRAKIKKKKAPLRFGAAKRIVDRLQKRSATPRTVIR